MLAGMLVFEKVLIRHIKDRQFQDPKLARVLDHIAMRPDFRIGDGSSVFLGQIVCARCGRFEESDYDIGTSHKIFCVSGVHRCTKF